MDKVNNVQAFVLLASQNCFLKFKKNKGDKSGHFKTVMTILNLDDILLYNTTCRIFFGYPNNGGSPWLASLDFKPSWVHKNTSTFFSNPPAAWQHNSYFPTNQAILVYLSLQIQRERHPLFILLYLYIECRSLKWHTQPSLWELIVQQPLLVMSVTRLPWGSADGSPPPSVGSMNNHTNSAKLGTKSHLSARKKLSPGLLLPATIRIFPPRHLII